MRNERTDHQVPMDDNPLQRVAIHEAGHAIVATALGFTVTRIDLWVEDQGDAFRFVGCTHLDDANESERLATRPGVLDCVAVLTAGHAAERALDGGGYAVPTLDEIAERHGADAEAIRALLPRLSLEPPPLAHDAALRRQWRRARRILDGAWPAAWNTACVAYNAFRDTTDGQVVVARCEVPAADFASVLAHLLREPKTKKVG